MPCSLSGGRRAFRHYCIKSKGSGQIHLLSRGVRLPLPCHCAAGAAPRDHPGGDGRPHRVRSFPADEARRGGGAKLGAGGGAGWGIRRQPAPGYLCVLATRWPACRQSTQACCVYRSFARPPGHRGPRCASRDQSCPARSRSELTAPVSAHAELQIHRIRCQFRHGPLTAGASRRIWTDNRHEPRLGPGHGPGHGPQLR